MAVTANQKILTHNYWKPASKIEVGDYVFDKDGKPVRVKLVQQYFSDNCYEVLLSDGLTISGDEHLGFPMEHKKYRDRMYKYKGVHKFRRPLKPTKASELFDLPLADRHNNSKYSIPSTKPICLPYQDLPVHPFVFGFWLINKNPDNELQPPKEHFDFIKDKLMDCGYKMITINARTSNRKAYKTQPTIESHLIPNIPSTIPNNYLLASPEQRIELLSGILYAKRAQYNKLSDTFRFTGKSYQLLKQIQGITESLGLRTKLNYREDFNEYTLSFKSRLILMHHQESPKVKVHLTRRYLSKIEKIQPQMCVHIETEGADNSFLVGEGFIPCL